MATIKQVNDNLVSLVTDIVYPDGTGMPSIAGVDVVIYAGWPVKNRLDVDLAAGKAHVSIFAVGQSDKDMTKFYRYDQPIVVTPATLTSTITSPSDVTIGGTVSVPQAVMIVYNKVGYSHTVLFTDTLDDIAAGLAAQIPGASSVGAVVTMTGVITLSTTVITEGTYSYESKRQQKIYWISVWSPSFDVRDTLSDPIDVTLGDLERFTLPDNTSALITYRGLQEVDMFQKSFIYRRDLIYTIEYATNVEKKVATIGDAFINSLTVNYGGL